MIKENQRFILKYNQRLSSSFSMLLFGLLLVFSGWFKTAQPWMRIISLSLGMLLLFLFIYQMVLLKKPFQFLVDFKEEVLLIDGGLGKVKTVPFEEIRGVALGVQTAKYTQEYLLQFAVSPECWCKFYHKHAAKTAAYLLDYEEMYLVFHGRHQKRQPMEELVELLEAAGISFRTYVEPVLGGYPGKVKLTRKVGHQIEEVPALKQQKRRQMISYFFRTFFILVAFLFIAIQLLGHFHGIYW